ncbi:MAG TPA: SUF system NifU family Fe-S cluster assembly protein [Vicinamibacterales bacterium]|nr:SUF system NifU family Fe-S cluster assembly protein [Vicinamibacterales bacterium]
MAADIETLYRDVILDHNRRPRNFRVLEDGGKAEGSNPLCGDRLTVYLRVASETIQDAAFQGYGCAIAIASASLMTESVKGKTLAEAEALFEQLLQMITAPAEAPLGDLGGLSALAGVRQFPVRVKCATLPWQALRAAAAGRVEVVSTE